MLDAWQNGIIPVAIVIALLVAVSLVGMGINAVYDRSSDRGKALMAVTGIMLLLFVLLPMFIGSGL